jgi:type IV fimbrial biogenesis protein FimT
MEKKLKGNSVLTRGFTLLELMIVTAIIAIVLGTALPSFVQWRKGLRYREATNGLVASLRTARSTAITTNRQVEIEFLGNTYRTGIGNRAIASTVWSNSTWNVLAAGVGLNTPNSRIIANPNGALFFTSVSDSTSVFSSVSTNITVFVQDASVTPAVNRYSIVLSQTGRIGVTRVN